MLVVPTHQATQPGGIGSLGSVLGLLKSLKSRAQLRPGPAADLQLFVGGCRLRGIAYVSCLCLTGVLL